MAHRKRRRVQDERVPRGAGTRSPEEIRDAARARLAVAQLCPRCASPILPNASGRGRPRVWCSQQCRRAAYEERRAAAAGAIAKEIVVRRVEPSWTETIERVLQSPKACRHVLQALQERLVRGELAYSPWDSVSADLWHLSKTFASRQ